MPSRKLIVSYLVGTRGPSNCYDFMKDIASRLTSRVQLTTDGLYWYVDAVDHAFGVDVDFGMIQKHYGQGTGRRFGIDALQPREVHEPDQGGHNRQPE